MAWTTDLVLFVRTLIGDLDSTKYTDSRLQQIIAVSAYKVNEQADFDNDYSVDMSAKTISPDPVTNTDSDFTVLTAYQAACMILGSEVKTEAANSIMLRDGPSSIDLRGVTGSLNTLYNSLCEKFEQLMTVYKSTNKIHGQAVLGPYSPGSSVVSRQYSYGDPRSGWSNFQ
jgi:hypothetical protein